MFNRANPLLDASLQIVYKERMGVGVQLLSLVACKIPRLLTTCGEVKYCGWPIGHLKHSGLRRSPIDNPLWQKNSYHGTSSQDPSNGVPKKEFLFLSSEN